MNECWNFFKYAKLSDIDEIENLVYENSEWFSHLSKDHFIKKINNKECIYESGVLISFKIIKKKNSVRKLQCSCRKYNIRTNN